MAGRAKAIKVNPDSELFRLLEAADDDPVLLDKDGVLYRLTRESEGLTLPRTDPALVNETLDETAGSWSDLDTDQLIADLFEARAQGSRPADRPR